MNWNKQVINRKTALQFAYELCKVGFWPDDKAEKIAELAFNYCEQLVLHDGRTEQARELMRKIRDMQVRLIEHIESLPHEKKEILFRGPKKCGCGCGRLSTEGDFLPRHDVVFKNNLLGLWEHHYEPVTSLEKILYDQGKFSYKPISMR